MGAAGAPAEAGLLLDGLAGLLRGAAAATRDFLSGVQGRIAARLAGPDGLDRDRADAEQHVVHGYGWFAAYGELINQVAGWAERLESEGSFGEVEALLAQLLVGEYAAQLTGGIAMNQGEIIRASVDTGCQDGAQISLQCISTNQMGVTTGDASAGSASH